MLPPFSRFLRVMQRTVVRRGLDQMIYAESKFWCDAHRYIIWWHSKANQRVDLSEELSCCSGWISLSRKGNRISPLIYAAALVRSLCQKNSSSRTREITLQILHRLLRRPRVHHRTILPPGLEIRTRPPRITQPDESERRIVRKRHTAARSLELSGAVEEEGRWQAPDGDGGPGAGEGAQGVGTLLSACVIEDSDVKEGIELAVHGGAALEEVFPGGALLGVAVHGVGVVGEAVRCVLFGGHVELEGVVVAGSGVGAIVGFAVHCYRLLLMENSSGRIRNVVFCLPWVCACQVEFYLPEVAVLDCSRARPGLPSIRGGPLNEFLELGFTTYSKT